MEARGRAASALRNSGYERTKEEARITLSHGISLLSDHELAAKLTEGDMIAREKKYHLNCLAAFYKRCRPKATSRNDEMPHAIEGIAFSDLLSYIEEVLVRQMGDESYLVFKMKDLVKLKIPLRDPTSNYPRKS